MKLTTIFWKRCSSLFSLGSFTKATSLPQLETTQQNSIVRWPIIPVTTYLRHWKLNPMPQQKDSRNSGTSMRISSDQLSWRKALFQSTRARKYKCCNCPADLVDRMLKLSINAQRPLIFLGKEKSRSRLIGPQCNVQVLDSRGPGLRDDNEIDRLLIGYSDDPI